MDDRRPGPDDELIETTEEGGPESEPDTEGQSMLTYELGLEVARERRRESERATREAWKLTGSTRERRPGLLDRIRRR